MKVLKNNKTKVKIICSEHGVFEQKPNSHLNGNGCPHCAQEEKGCQRPAGHVFSRVPALEGT